ncbi:Prolyl-tRNA synthetase [[Mycoplasma] cavipharyngis]|uniref:proline--tRNA ligase n=1 Tax=[Mycoplasma] cavipharyngis TaxID=92757 RepID=UPI0037038F85
MNQNRIKKQSDNFSGWYDSVIEHAKLAQPGLVKGTIFILPYAWAIWEEIQNFINCQFKKEAISNVNFPSFLTQEAFIKEKKHIAGFAPELFLIQQSEHLTQKPYVLRPTSEIIFCHYFKNNLQSYNQLPIKVNQWCNVFRAEKNTKAFLRTCEFFWQELHTLHADWFEAETMIKTVINVYSDCLSKLLNIAFLSGYKTKLEKFAGADETFSLESLMPDGQMLQSCTVHNLSTNFTKAFDIYFNDANNQKQLPYQTSAGISTRILGAIIMNHGDDKGLVLPFQVAPYQIAILDLVHNKTNEQQKYFDQIVASLKSYRYKIDNTKKGFGFKIQNEELLGTPFSIVVGSKEIDQKVVLCINRFNSSKEIVPINQLDIWLTTKIEWYQMQMLTKSQKRLNDAIVLCENFEQVIKVVQEQKIALAAWFDDVDNENKFYEAKLGFSIRCIQKRINPSQQQLCIFSQKPANCLVYFARSY